MESQTLAMLKRLQAAVIKLSKARQEKETAERRVTRYNCQLADSDIRIEEGQKALATKRDVLATQSREMAAREENLSQQLSASEAEDSNPERDTLLRTVNRDRTELARLKQSIAQLELELQALQKKQAKAERTRRDIEERLQNAERSLSNSSRADRRALRHAEEVQKACEGQIEAEILDAFLVAAGLHDGEGLAKLTKPHPKRSEYSCSGCHMCVSLDTIDSLKRSNAVPRCNNCNRIVYLNGRENR